MRRSHSRRTAEAKGRARAGFLSFDFAIAWGRVGYKRIEQFSRDSGYFVNRVI